MLEPAVHQSILSDYEQYSKLQERYGFVTSRYSMYHTDLHEILELVSIDKPIAVTSHRPLLGPLIVFAKKTLMILAQPVIKIVLKRQIYLNQFIIKMYCEVNSLRNRVIELEADRLALKRRLDKSDSYDS